MTASNSKMATVKTSKIYFLLLIVLSITGKYEAVDSLRFLVIGDWGGLPTPPYTTAIEKGTAEEMGVIASRYGASFITALGDNFYYDGVNNISDPRFILDHNGNVTAQILYTHISKRWNFPELYYTLTFPVPGSKATVDIIMIDTVTLCGNVLDDFHGYQPKGPDDVKLAEDQWEWIERSLAKSSATYLLVAGHFPVYSIAEHGPTQCLVDRLLPMLYQYQVTAYMCGHDHNLQHLQTAENGIPVNYILSGSSNFIDTSVEHKYNVPEGSSLFHWADPTSLGGFVFTEVTTSNITFTYLDAKGTKLHYVSLPPRNV